ncbi:MAG: diguanylate cyclase [Candidatus Thiodiazotropha lotti]|nr:diguanylate cyclase [Candidatus Thiodiazotropha lotti]MCW4222384.1 diguanylate cyclase [Candidatus Thiodiazotropha lotti]
MFSYWLPRVFPAIFLLLIILSPPVFGQTHPDSTDVGDDFRFATLTGVMQVLLDPERQLDIDSASAATLHSQYQDVSNGGKIGFTDAAVWTRFTLASHLSSAQTFLLELDYPLMDRIELYEPDGQASFRKRLGGDAFLFSARDVQVRTNVFTIDLVPGEIKTLYMRLTTNGSIQLPVRLWNQIAFAEYVAQSQLWFGLYFGAIVLLVASAIGGLLFLKSPLFFWYALYLTFYGLLNFTLTGLGFQFIWPGFPLWQDMAPSFFVGVVVITAMIFSSKLLDIAQYSRTFYHLFWLTAVLAAIGIFLSLTGYTGFAKRVSSFSGLVLVPIVMLAAVIAYRGGNLAARYFLIAWGVFLIFVFISGLYYWGVLPHNFVTAYALQLGSVFEVTMLGMALAERVASLNREKEQADQQARGYLTLLNEKLESLVRERTSELEASNQRLEELATHDSLTLLLNHHAVLRALEGVINASERHGQSFCIAIVDVDNFKQINDQFGHQVGDEVLVAIANTLSSSLRTYDIAGRYGGEEFLLILPQTSTDDASDLIDRLRLSVSDLVLNNTGGERITVSAGMMAYEHGVSMDVEALFRCADDALYLAKDRGKDRIEWGSLKSLDRSLKGFADEKGGHKFHCIKE